MKEFKNTLAAYPLFCTEKGIKWTEFEYPTWLAVPAESPFRGRVFYIRYFKGKAQYSQQESPDFWQHMGNDPLEQFRWHLKNGVFYVD